MKTIYVFLGILLLSVTPGLAQRASSRWANYDAVTTYGIGLQGVRLHELNQALQQAGYNALPTQLPMLSIASQFSRPNRPVSFLAELGMPLGSGSTVTNGTYKTRVGFFYAKLGASYRLINSEKFQLGPQAALVALPFHMRISPVNNATPPLGTVLTNPGSAQTANLGTNTLGLDAGLTANLRFPYLQRQIDCATIERSFVVGLDAGYRLAARVPLDALQEFSTTNPGIQLSGWYARLRIGFGMRVRSSNAPTTY